MSLPEPTDDAPPVVKRLLPGALEPLVPILLSAHALVTLAFRGASTPAQLAILVTVGLLGVAGLVGWRGTTALLVRANALVLAALVLAVSDHSLMTHVLQWWYCVVAVYPLILRRRLALIGAGSLGASLFALLPLGVPGPSVTVLAWLLRAVVLTCLGVIVALAGDAYRNARQDADERRGENEQIGHQLRRASSHDGLTGLPNRTTASEYVAAALRGRSGADDDQVAVLVMDLDRFKYVNESLGHLAGDSLLREVAGRLGCALPPGEQLARLGGDEFVLVCSSTDVHRARRTAQRLVDLFTDPVPLAGSTYRIGLSVGVAVSGGGLEGTTDLFRAADAALYAAKDAGRGQAMMFDPVMGAAAEADLAIELRLREALERAEGSTVPRHDEVTAVFQPVVCLRSGRVVSAEALARWVVDGEPVSPLRFVPLAEELGLGHQLTMSMVRQSLRALVCWRAAGCAHVESIAVNVGPRELLRPGLAAELADMVTTAGLSPGSLTLEITERDVVVDVEEARAALHSLRSAGITVAIDDFGTGFSSLAYLARLPVHVLKIDREFVAALDTDATIARTVMDLARSFGLQCIAEGIETEGQLTALAALGVHAGQGWHLGRPTSATEFVHLARAEPIRV